MRHQSDYNSFGRLGFDRLFSVYGGQLALFASIMGLELAPLASKVGPFGFKLQMHRNIFANHYRPSPCDESGNTRQETVVRAACAQATPSMRLTVVTILSLAPSTEARNLPIFSE